MEFTKNVEEANRDIVAKIKAINIEKNEIEQKLKDEYQKTEEQCNKFKEEYKKNLMKYQMKL